MAKKKIAYRKNKLRFSFLRDQYFLVQKFFKIIWRKLSSAVR